MIRRLKSRRSGNANDPAVEITLCGCEIDPLTGSGQFYQLFCMIGLPTIPVLVLVVYSSIKLAAAVDSYNRINSLGSAFPVVLSTIGIVSAVEEEMTGVASYSSSNGSNILGSLRELYEATEVSLESVKFWPDVDADGSAGLNTKQGFKNFLNGHRTTWNESFSETSVIKIIEFYDSTATKFVDWSSGTVFDRVDSRIWTKLFAFDSLSRSVASLGKTRALGTAYFYRGHFAGDELTEFVVSNTLGPDELVVGVTFDPRLDRAYTAMLRSNSEFWKSMESLRKSSSDSSAASGGGGGRDGVTAGTIWHRRSSVALRGIDRLLETTVDDALDFVAARQDETRRAVAFYAASVCVMLFCMVPVSVSMALTTTGSLMSYVKTMERKSVGIKREKRKTERLLNEMLPRSVAYQLRKGEHIEAEQFQSVTVLFSDIADFTDISISSVPFDIVHFLNDLYNFIDAQIVKYDVYKVRRSRKLHTNN